MFQAGINIILVSKKLTLQLGLTLQALFAKISRFNWLSLYFPICVQQKVELNYISSLQKDFLQTYNLTYFDSA